MSGKSIIHNSGKVHVTILALVALCTPALLLADSTKEVDQRLEAASTALQQVMRADDKSIPRDLLNDARCAVVIPGLKKGGFIVSGEYGKGFMTCRKTDHGPWSAPAAVTVEGGGFGFQIGGAETDVFMLVMDQEGEKHLMSSQFTLGGEGQIAAGPVGRDATAQTDAEFHAKILSWSRTRGVFAGVSLKGATLREDEDSNKALYGKKLSTKQVIDTMTPPPAAQPLLSQLSADSPEKEK